MIFERITTPGLAHYSYLIGDAGEAIVIDPRRDIEIYTELAQKLGVRITHVLETHCHEDFLLGSKELATWTSGQIWHADSQFDYQYGNSVHHAQTWIVGTLKVEAIASPGHTPGSMSYLVYDKRGAPWLLFTGDTLFAGGVGRTDLSGADLLEEMTRQLYETLYHKILHVGNEVLVYPAHGPGSSCGDIPGHRDLTTIGMERVHNPYLQFDQAESFVKAVARFHPLPPYFSAMHQGNLSGAQPLGFSFPQPLSPESIAYELDERQVIDIRPVDAFAAAHLPGSLSLWTAGVAPHAGWFLDHEDPIVLVGEHADMRFAYETLRRMGYDNIQGFLRGGMLSWITAGYEVHSLPITMVQNFCDRLMSGGNPWVLDIRSDSEVLSTGHLPGAHLIPLNQVPDRLDEIPRNRPVHVMCGNGQRSMLVASYLERLRGFQPVVIMGGFEGWQAIACPAELPSGKGVEV